ncbi:NlpC/P60 family protein [Actinomadura craniellae]|uniref:NlpC/P60 family protein n=1 Tax=Actinomadura craniellae TaxID=2231787 RepID=A0A365H8M9_9ACTN|nr:NlpC/P60 family protein [Actinomadura craniellae]RAY15372.1 NlpC/P60 family protein [Actinomadura craniellae]
MGAALALTVLGVPAPRAAADPVPSARDVAEGKRKVRARAEEVGRAKGRLARADGELDQLSVQAAAAVERYHGEMVHLARAGRAYEDARRRLAEAEQRYERERADMAAFAASAYRTGTGTSSWGVAVPGGPQHFLDRAGMVEIMARRQAGMIDRVEAARTVADLFRRRAWNALVEQRSAAARADRARRAAETAVARQRAATLRIEQEKRELERQLYGARAHAAALARRRAEGLAAARRARLAAARAAARRDPAGSGRSLAKLHGSARGMTVVRAALRWLGTPYSWGGGTAAGPSYGIAHGRHIRGFDCSGLALYAWDKVGVRLDHWTGTQWTAGPRVPTGMLRPGDLVFFAYDTGDPDTIHHVGIYIGGGKMVEAPYTGAHVRISSIWRNGLIGAVRPVT